MKRKRRSEYRSREEYLSFRRLNRKSKRQFRHLVLLAGRHSAVESEQDYENRLQLERGLEL